MKVIHSPAELGSSGPTVATIGNFDGVHRGHAAILASVRERARALGAAAVAITFDPHPLTLVAPDRAPLAIMTLEQRVAAIAEHGIDLLLVQPFNEPFSRLSPERFISRYLIDAFQVRSLSVGQNFRFGHRHRGNLETLRGWADRFDVVEVPPVVVGGKLVSSSRVRQALGEGDASTARRMLGRCYEMEGRVVSGAGRGRSVAVPTLNMKPANPLLPADGVYLTRVSIDGGPFRDSITNVGVRPTFDETERTIETHLLGEAPTAGVTGVRLRFVVRVRDERRFADVEALRAQIARDVAFAGRFFRRLDERRDRTSGRGVACASSPR